MKKHVKQSFGVFKRNAGRITVLSIMTVMVMNGLFASSASLKGIDGVRGVGSSVVMVVSAYDDIDLQADLIYDDAYEYEYAATLDHDKADKAGRAAADAFLASHGRPPKYSMGSSGTAGGLFTDIMDFIAQWIVALGIGIAFFGAIQLAFGFRSDDAEGKNKGLRAMIAGLIVAAIGGAWSTFSDWAGTPKLTTP